MSEATSGPRSAKDLVLRMFELINCGEAEKLDEVADRDIVVEWPQSAERVRGIENLKHILEEYPGGLQPDPASAVFVQGDDDRFLLTPMFTMVHAQGTAEQAVSTVKSRYPDGTDWYIVGIANAHGGKLVRLTQYFAPVYEAPPWRAKWVEPMEAEG